ncbi:hypothetical protein EON83_27550 [bacterium]|nr:MAG: hypothetical protein EON83_27550 [bacterium]
MKTIGSLYSLFLESNRDAFAQRHFVLAYHALSGAMHCALHLQDSAKLAEVEVSATEQLHDIQEQFSSSAPEQQEVNLYISLVQIIKTRRFLLQIKSTSK